MSVHSAITYDPTATALTEEIAAARVAIVDLCERDRERTWHAYELKARARNGWSAGAMNLAFNDLLDEGVFHLEGDCVRLRS